MKKRKLQEIKNSITITNRNEEQARIESQKIKDYEENLLKIGKKTPEGIECENALENMKSRVLKKLIKKQTETQKRREMYK